MKVRQATQLFWTVREVVDLLAGSYCGSATVEAAHLPSAEQQLWVSEQWERPVTRDLFTPGEKRDILFRLLYADEFERFLAAKFPSSKRFGLEGCESLLVGLYAMLRRAAEEGVEAVELGMAHRGRLCVLHAVLGKPLGDIISEFRAPGGELRFVTVGDVKYHLVSFHQVWGDGCFSCPASLPR